MGFYIRKSLSFGPLRLNLSKSGLGLSAGVKGFRIGSGPRGNYIHAGRGGLYYRATLPGGGSRGRSVPATPNPHVEPAAPQQEPMVEIESGEASTMADQNSGELLAELNAKHKIVSTWPFALAATVLTLVLAFVNSPAIWIVLAVLLAGLTILSAWWDRNRKTTVLFYDLQPPVLPAFEAIHAAFEQLAACQGTWLIEAQSRSLDVKYTAGASTTVRRRRIGLADKAPPYVKTNIPVPSLPVGRQRLYLLPDRVLVYDERGIGAVAYESLDLLVTSQRFVENEGLPSDAEVVDRSWKYVNKNGGPDRRFRDNPELPIALYDELRLSSVSGLNEMLQLSRRGVAQGFISSVDRLARALAEAQTSPLVPPLPSQEELVPHSEPQEEVSGAEATPLPATNMESLTADAAQLSTGEPRKFFYFEGSVRGPISAAELADLLQKGAITMETQVCTDEDTRWIAYQEMLVRNGA